MPSGPSLPSLADFAQYDPASVIRSPRSLAACKSEGILPQDVIYRPMDAFSERNLSPRLVKLRHDFFEAKRKDLIAAAKRARDALIVDEERKEARKGGAIQTLAKQTGVSTAALMALNSDGLKLERQKLLRAQEREKAWLNSALNNELRQLQILEKNTKKLETEEDDTRLKLADTAQRTKELNDRRQAEDERKTREFQAQHKLEKMIAKQEFERQQDILEREREKEREKQKEIYQRQLAEMDRKREAEADKERQKEERWRKQQDRIEEMRAQDLRRTEVLDQQRARQQHEMLAKKEDKEMRIYQSIENNVELEKERRRKLEEKMMQEQLREESLAQRRALQQEEGAKQAFQLMMRRQSIHFQAARQQEERRLEILQDQQETEERLLEHELKKERYLDFKRELDSLKQKNKEINVERERRRQENQRERVAQEVKRKDEKQDIVKLERQRLWELRRSTQVEAYRARESVKTQILSQRVKSKLDSTVVERQLGKVLGSATFSPKILASSRSSSMPAMPTTKRAVTAQEGSSVQTAMGAAAA